MRRNLHTRNLRAVALLCLILLGLFPRALWAQQESSTQEEFWPELNVFIGLNQATRIFLMVSRAKARDFRYAEAMFGAHVDFGIKPRIRIAMQGLDASKMQHLSGRVGYRYNRSAQDIIDGFREHRGVVELTPRYPLPAKLLLSNRNRVDLRWVNDVFSWRYRNRLTLEREWRVRERLALTPYGSGELYYDSRFDVWNRNRYALGLQTTLTRNIMIDVYFMRQNDSRSNPPHVNAIGAALNLFF